MFFFPPTYAPPAFAPYPMTFPMDYGLGYAPPYGGFVDEGMYPPPPMFAAEPMFAAPPVWPEYGFYQPQGEFFDYGYQPAGEVYGFGGGFDPWGFAVGPVPAFDTGLAMHLPMVVPLVHHPVQMPPMVWGNGLQRSASYAHPVAASPVASPVRTAARPLGPSVSFVATPAHYQSPFAKASAKPSAQPDKAEKAPARARGLRLGDIAPDFTQDSTEGKIKLHSYLGGKWGILFSHPADFTPVCTTELGEVARLKAEWDKRSVKPIGLSCDPVDSHKKWAKDIEETQKQRLNYPLIADADRSVATLYGMLDDTNKDSKGLPMTVRSVFIIDPAKKIRLIITYPASTGRNFDEILRVLDSLQLTDNHKVATPVNWKQGDDCVILPSVSMEDAKKRFPKGFKVVKPYLRVTPSPV